MSLWAFSVRRWQFTLVVFALLVATGLWALDTIPRAEDPTLKFPGLADCRHLSRRRSRGHREADRRSDRGRTVGT